jgi:hypothetical protein
MTMAESETVTLTEHWLGLKPYVLIEADTDPADGELVLKVKAGGGAAEMIGALPMMMLTELPAETNPLTVAIGEYLTEFPAHREALAGFAECIGAPMPAEPADG